MTFNKFLKLWLIPLILVIAAYGCTKSNEDECVVDTSYQPAIDSDHFAADSATVDNTYLPFTPGVTTYKEYSENDVEISEITVTVTNDTKTIMGVECIVVHDVCMEGTFKAEDTWDWYAQDVDGNVWYFGEDTTAYETDGTSDKEGSWEAGVDGALPGVVMWADPEVGDPYRQEYYACEAEDMAQVLAITETIVVQGITYNNCVRTKDYNPLEPGIVENKWYAPGIGMVRAEIVEGEGTGEYEDLIP